MRSSKDSRLRPRRLLALLEKFQRARIVVVGDLMLDRFIFGEVERISPEAPVPVFRVTSESSRLGGAANVAHNIRTLGGRVTVCGVIGADEAGRRLLRQLKSIGCSTAGVYSGPDFQTTQKSRLVAHPRHQQIVRLDHEDHGGMAPRVLARLRRFLERDAARHDGMVVSDYGKGVIHPELLAQVSDLAQARNLLCVVDPKKENFSRYRGCTLLTPNRDEASEASGIDIHDEDSLAEAGAKLLTLWRSKAVLITRGPEGMSLFRHDGEKDDFPTAAREVFDVTGAGDTVVATCALALAAGSTFEEAAVMANLAAGIVVGEVGTVAVSTDRLRKAIRALR